jgi:hypothetical protein
MNARTQEATRRAIGAPACKLNVAAVSLFYDRQTDMTAPQCTSSLINVSLGRIPELCETHGGADSGPSPGRSRTNPARLPASGNITNSGPR